MCCLTKQAIKKSCKLGCKENKKRVAFQNLMWYVDQMEAKIAIQKNTG